MTSTPRPTVVVGLLGLQVDRGGWGSWRPTVDLCRHEGLLVRRLELLVQPAARRLADEIVRDVGSVSPETEVVRHDVDFADPWDFEEVYGVLLDFAERRRFDPEAEDLLVHITTGSHVAQICLYLLTEARWLPGRLLQTSPPRRGERTGTGHYDVIDLDLSRYDRLHARFERRAEEGRSALKAGIATENARFNALIERIEQVAIRSKDPILLLGPTGAGKSQLARRIHALKRERRELAGPFVEVNCATLRGENAMSALFGHARGAFTGAVAARPGLLRAADGGMLFLDEIGELGLDEQAMLLRALEEGTFLPLGSDAEVSSRFELIAGTNRDLRGAVATGRFRDDLLSRIDLWTFELPPLRERPEDVEPNLDHELERVQRQEGRRVSLNAEARRAFLDFARGPRGLWPGNFRDFGAAIKRLATLAPGGRIGRDLVDEEIQRLERAWSAARPPSDPDALLEPLLGREALERLDRFDRVQLAEVVRACREHATLSEAGRALFAASRSRRTALNDADRLRKYLARHALSFDDVRR
jgi:transcriptional regulatory protein RtcR